MCTRPSLFRRIPQRRGRDGPPPCIKPSHRFGHQPCLWIQPNLFLFYKSCKYQTVPRYTSTYHTVPPKIHICINPGLFAVMQCLNSESKTILEKRGKAGPYPAVRPAGLVRFVPKMLPQYFPGKFLICRYCREAECPSSLPFTRGSSRGRPPL